MAHENKKNEIAKKMYHDKSSGKSYTMPHDALGHAMISRVRDKKIEGYRHMSGSSRYNAKMSRTFDNAKEDKHDPIIKSVIRHHRRHRDN